MKSNNSNNSNNIPKSNKKKKNLISNNSNNIPKSNNVMNMPKKPKIAEFKKGDMVLKIYDKKILDEILRKFFSGQLKPPETSPVEMSPKGDTKND